MPRWCGAAGITVTGGMVLHFILSLQVVVVFATLVRFAIAMRRLSLGCELPSPLLMKVCGFRRRCVHPFICRLGNATCRLNQTALVQQLFSIR